MSIWSSATGTVTVDNSEHFSLKKYTHSLYDEMTLNIEYGCELVSLRTDKFHLSVCLDGMQAMEFFNKWMEGVPGHVDMTVELRMVK
jgi:hypothetical protein